MTAEPWPRYLVQSFISANQAQFATDQSVYYGPYTRLLYYLFGLDDPFEISPQFHIPEAPRDAIYVVALFTVELNKHPVFFVEVKPPASFALDSKRKQADGRMRDRFRDLRRSVVTPVSLLSAHSAPACPSMTCDLLDADGIARVRQVAQDVRAMCQRLQPLAN
ncbi:hypothetical protein FA13DRAFT_1756488 [Coprinellus micaceus]|uniref:Fungal-type protein kinase domain-containing protein n=1 Tax=Coprinellus micaceus TaxID=71717 RepID=A0A4Y7SVZ7_COPMI|nr:hypothetical protein FA13DRAFT_1756488 [Coprinellus micaceus]